MTRRVIALAIAAGAAWAGAPVAHAAWPGTPGRVAFLDTDDPALPLTVAVPRGASVREEVVVPRTFFDGRDGLTPPTTGLPSAPAWSPDGTRVAFASAVPDPGGGPGATHLAIFVWTLRTGAIERVTTPPPAVLDDGTDDADTGFAAADIAPAWSPDGKRLAFVRFTAAGADAPRFPDRGGEVHVVGADGGAPVRVTRIGAEGMFTALAWGGDPDGDSLLVGSRADAAGVRLLAIDPASGAVRSLVPGALAALVRDFDVAPDGRTVDLVTADGQATTVDAARGDRTALGPLGPVPALRSSPTGNGPLHVGRAVVPGDGVRAGLVERRRPDPNGDVWPEDPQDRWVSAVLRAGGEAAVAAPHRRLWDVQAQRLPIITIPGFAGSTIRCGRDDVLWPPGLTGNDRRLAQMTLAADGRTDTGCAGPTADPDDPDALVSTVFGVKEIYAPQERFLDRIAPGDRGFRFSWDWRKAPRESAARLDAFIRRVLATDLALDQGADRVVLFAHSYGGFLIRELIDRAPERVARALTAGTPWLGVPKPAFFLGYGIENPVGGALDLDAVLPDAEARAFARTSAGVHHLIAQDQAPRWLTLGGRFQDADAARAWLAGSLGANPGLLAQARAWHRRYDGFSTARGLVDVRAVIGTGHLTIDGIEAPAGGTSPPSRVEIRMANGDVTVPAFSAGQGPLGGRAPLGDPVHVQAVCRVPHMELGGSAPVIEAYADYLLTGRTPRRTDGGRACPAAGSVIEVRSLAAPRRARAGNAPTLEQAAAAGDLQLLELPSSRIAVVDDHRPADVGLGGDPRERTEVRVTRWEQDVPRPVVTYSAVPGDARLRTFRDGTVTIIAGGRELVPDGDDGRAVSAPGGAAVSPASRVRPVVRTLRVAALASGRLRIAARMTGAARLRVTVRVLRGTCARRPARCPLAARRVFGVRGGVVRADLRMRSSVGGRRLLVEVLPVGADGARGRAVTRRVRAAG